jgi:hypothetical protein
MEDRISLEKRLRRRVARLGALLSKIGVGHYRRELFFDRLPYLSDFQLTVDDYSLIIMVGVVSELSWRYDAFKWEA